MNLMSVNALYSLTSRAIIIASSINEGRGEGWGGIKLGRAGGNLASSG